MDYPCPFVYQKGRNRMLWPYLSFYGSNSLWEFDSIEESLLYFNFQPVFHRITSYNYIRIITFAISYPRCTIVILHPSSIVHLVPAHPHAFTPTRARPAHPCPPPHVVRVPTNGPRARICNSSVIFARNSVIFFSGLVIFYFCLVILFF